MKTIILFVIVFSFLSIALAEKCSLEDLADFEYTDIECQFYMGTTAYRHELYEVAAAHWQFILDAPIRYSADENLKLMSLSTLNYLTYYGLGVKQNRSKAVKVWEEAAAKGDFEARRHLGYAYADNRYNNKNTIKALGWIESIFILYPDAENLSEPDKNIYNDAQEQAIQLREKLTLLQIEEALSFALSTIQ